MFIKISQLIKIVHVSYMRNQIRKPHLRSTFFFVTKVFQTTRQEKTFFNKLHFSTTVCLVMYVRLACFHELRYSYK
jgi:hypothetical protein